MTTEASDRPALTPEQELAEQARAHQAARERFELVLRTAPALNPYEFQTLQEVLEPVMQHSQADLAIMPGTPGQVLCAQFLHYVRAHYKLREPLLQDDAAFENLARRLRAIPEPVKATSARRRR